MLRNNIVTPLYSKWLDKKPGKTYWIGQDAAYQLPAHYWTVRTMVQKQTLYIEPKDIIQEKSRKSEMKHHETRYRTYKEI